MEESNNNGVYRYSDNNKRRPELIRDKKLDRNVARWRMKQRGYTQVTKKKSGHSFFAEHWREFVY